MSGGELSSLVSGMAKQPYVVMPTSVIALMAFIWWRSVSVEIPLPPNIVELTESVIRSEEQLRNIAAGQNKNNESIDKILAAYVGVQIEVRENKGNINLNRRDIDGNKEDIKEFRQEFYKRMGPVPFNGD